MKAPKCWACDGRHWSTQPCPASNSASNRRLTASNGGKRSPAADKRSLEPATQGTAGADSSEAPSAAAPRVPHQRWERDRYNAYMKGYMKTYRERK